MRFAVMEQEESSWKQPPLGEGPGSALGSTTELGAHQAPTAGWAQTVAWVKTCSFRRC